MEVGRGVEVLNLHDWLPGHGENGVYLQTHNGDLLVTVLYDSEYGELRKKILFRHTVAFYKAAFPGPNLLGLHCSVHNDISMSALIEHPDSEAAHAWTQHFKSLFIIKHYSIMFLSENIVLEVFAEDFALTDAI